MKTSFALLVSSLLVLFFFDGCKKNKDVILANSLNQFDNSKMVQATIMGTIVDELGEPIAGASVNLGNSYFTTNQYGFFYFTNAYTKARATHLTVTKTGYFDGHRTLIPIAGQDNQVKIKLLTKGNPLHFQNADGGAFSLENNVKITFEKNALVYKGTNTVYTGQVELYSKYIDPERADFDEVVPGSLRGIQGDGQDMLLKSFGMEIMEVYDQNGAELQIASDKDVELFMPLSASLAADATSEIPLWYFNEDNGMWVEEGKAVLENGVYRGNLAHFSMWNCDRSVPGVDFECRLIDQLGNPIQGAKVSFEGIVQNYGKFRGVVITNSEGRIKDKIPPNATLTLSFDLLDCGATNYTKTIQSNTTSTNLGDVVFAVPNSTQVKFTLKNCSGQLLKGGAVEFRYLGKYLNLISDNNGVVSAHLPCHASSNIRIITHDPDNEKYGLLDTLLTANLKYNLGNLFACGFEYQYMKVERSEQTTLCWEYQKMNWSAPEYTIVQSYDGSTLFNCKDINGNDSLTIKFTGPQNKIGPHTISYIKVGLDSIPNPNGIIAITSYGSINGYIKGQFNVNFTSPTTALPTTYACDFYIIRRQ